MKVQIRIKPTQVLGTIDPMIYGQYFEHVEDCIYPSLHDASSPLSNQRGLRRDVIDVAKELQVPLVRWPGGCFADIYHWEDGIGPQSERPVRLNWHWGEVESNQFGTDEFLAWCKLAGAKPYINVNMGTGTLQEAIRWLDYCNGNEPTSDVQNRARNGHPEPYNVEFWGLGNETWGHWEAGFSDAETYAHKLREWAQFFRKVSPGIKLLAVGSEGGNDPEWDKTVLRIAGEFIDYLTIHMYGHTTHLSDPDDYYATVSNAVSFEERLRSFSQVINEARTEYGLEHPIKISIDEWNIRHLEIRDDAKEPALRRSSLRTLKDALFVAGVFHAMHRQSDMVKMGCHVFFANGNAVINVHESGVLSSVIADVFRVYREHFTGQAVEVEKIDVPSIRMSVRQHQLDAAYQSVDLVDVSAVRSAEGKLSVAIINRHKSKQAQVSIDLPANYRLTNSQTLYDDDVLAANSLEDPNRVVFRSGGVDGNGGVVTTLPHSITVLEYTEEN